MKIFTVILITLLTAGMMYAQSVDFAVDLSVQMQKGNFDPAADTVFISGTFNGWGTGNILTDGNNDSIYTATIAAGAVNDIIEFKFRYYDVSGTAFVWEADPGRFHTLLSGTTAYSDFFNRDSVYYPAVDIQMTFGVNMEIERLSGRFDPATDTVSVNGTINGWTPKAFILLPNGLNPDLYEGTFTLHNAQNETIEFKYWYTDNNWESVDNRKYTFTAKDVTNLAASFEAAYNDGTLDNVLNQSATIKFTVRTNGAVSSIGGTPFTSVNSVALCGSTQPLQWPGGGWPTSDSGKTIKLYDDGTNGDVTGGDQIFSTNVTFTAYTPLTLQYKYGINYGDDANNGGGNDNEGGVGDNHILEMSQLMAGATAVDTFGRMHVANLINIVYPPADLDLAVDMSVQMKKGNFDPAADTVFVSGTFNGWGTGNILTDGNNDSIYTATVAAGNVNDNLEFKFRYYDVSGAAFVWEADPGRHYTLKSGTNTYADFFNRDSVYYPAVDIQMTFGVNMEIERLSGRFDPATDTVSVNGTINGWTPKAFILLPNGLNPDLYEGTFTLHNAQNETIEFKYWYTDNNWESVDNRKYTFTAKDVTNLAASFETAYNNGTLDNVLNQPCTIKFTVNTVGAVSSIGGTPFTSVNSVALCGSTQPLQWPGGGWPTSDSGKTIKLYDDGTNGDVTSGDQIFSTNVTFTAYTPLSLQYKYGINYGDDANNGGGNDNEGGVGDNHILEMSLLMIGATAVDTFGRMHVADLADVVVLDAKEEPGLPVAYSLNQNYPNPFNPSTTIKYTLASASYVTLIVYDMLGREVATLISAAQQPGEYSTEFSPTHFASGMYYYRLNAGSFSETRKMLFIK